MKKALLLISILLSLYSPITAESVHDKESAVIEQKQEKKFSDNINSFFEPVVEFMAVVLFWDPFEAMGIYDPTVYDDQGNVVYNADGTVKKSPVRLVVVWLLFGAIFFTVFMRFVNIRAFRHAIDLVMGKYSDPEHKGEVSHFQALTTALSGTVGLGNIASVAIAISIGGPGATFWMIVAGLLGMSSKFTECTLGVKYRRIDKDGVVSGGPMYYLKDALAKKNLKWLGSILAFIFSVLVVGGSLGGGNMFQANQSLSQFIAIAPGLENYKLEYGIVLAFLVGIVIIGGIKSIAKVTSRIVPIMAFIYVVTALIVIIVNFNRAGEAFMLIINGAFAPSALKGGFVGVLILGFQRAAFSNEAGVGSASIAHSAVKTNEPVTEGVVALLEPFIDTVLICTMTALVIIFTGLYENPDNLEGAQLTSAAFESVISWFPYVLVIAIFLFAFSTMISWSYYGLKGFDYLFGGIFQKIFGHKKYMKLSYRVIFLLAIVLGASSDLGVVLDFSDMMILSMAFPNIIGLVILAPEVRRDLEDYLNRVKSGEIKKYK